jgi:hypothetical protein
LVESRVGRPDLRTRLSGAGNAAGVAVLIIWCTGLCMQ